MLIRSNFCYIIFTVGGIGVYHHVFVIPNITENESINMHIFTVFVLKSSSRGLKTTDMEAFFIQIFATMDLICVSVNVTYSILQDK